MHDAGMANTPWSHHFRRVGPGFLRILAVARHPQIRATAEMVTLLLMAAQLANVGHDTDWTAV